MTTTSPAPPPAPPTSGINAGQQALLQVLASDIALFRDASDAPLIRLPPEIGGVWPLRSLRVRAWLAEAVWNRCGQLLRPRDADALLLVLEGRAWRAPAALAAATADGPADNSVAAGAAAPASAADALWAAVESDPLVAAVVELAAIAPAWEGRMCDLLERLTNLAVLRKLIEPAEAAGRGAPRGRPDERRVPWPCTAGALGVHLRRQSGLIERAGVRLSIARTNRGSFVRLSSESTSSAADAVGTDPPSSAEPIDQQESAAAAARSDGLRSPSSLSSSPHKSGPESDLRFDIDDRPSAASWPSSPLKSKNAKHLPQNGDDGDGRNRKKRRRRPSDSTRQKRARATHRPP